MAAMAIDRLDALKFAGERDVLAAHLGRPPLSRRDRMRVSAEAEALVRAARLGARRQGVVESFLSEFSLSTRSPTLPSMREDENTPEFVLEFDALGRATSPGARPARA